MTRYSSRNRRAKKRRELFYNESTITVPVFDFAPRHRFYQEKEKEFAEDVELGTPTAIKPQELQALRGFIQAARAWSVQFYRAASWNRNVHNYTSFFVLTVMGLTTGLSTLYNILAVKDDDTFAYRIVFNVLIAACTIVKAAQQAFGFDIKSMHHEMTADDFFSYVRTWNLRLAQGVDERRDKCQEAIVSAHLTLDHIERHAMPL